MNTLLKSNVFQTILPAILGHVPAGASIKQVIHYGQSLLSGEYLLKRAQNRKGCHFYQSNSNDFMLQANLGNTITE